MELTIENKTEILATLTRLLGATEKKSTIPILRNFHMHANGSLSVRATDLDIHLKNQCGGEIRIQQPGALCVEAKKLTEIIKSLPNDTEIKLKTKANNKLEILCGRSRFAMAFLEPENFPEMSAFDWEFTTFPGVLLGLLIRRVQFAITSEESRYTLNGIKFEFDGKRIRVVATDGHRLAYAESPVDTEYKGKKWDKLIPKRTLPELIRMADLGDVDMALSESGIFAQVGAHKLESRLLSGQFPNYELVLPTEAPNVAIVDVATLADSLKRVSVMTDERSHAIKMHLTKGGITLEAPATDHGDANESVDAEYTGEPLDVAFNAKYMAEYLAVCPTLKTTIELKNGNSQLQLRPVFDGGNKGGIDYRYVLMPMRL